MKLQARLNCYINQRTNFSVYLHNWPPWPWRQANTTLFTLSRIPCCVISSLSTSHSSPPHSILYSSPTLPRSSISSSNPILDHSLTFPNPPKINPSLRRTFCRSIFSVLVFYPWSFVATSTFHCCITLLIIILIFHSSFPLTFYPIYLPATPIPFFFILPHQTPFHIH